MGTIISPVKDAGKTENVQVVPAADLIINSAITYLNEILKADPVAIEALVEYRVPCNKALADHPTAQVSVGGDNLCRIGLLGVINGMFGTQPEWAKHPGWGYIAAVYDDNNKLMKFVRADKSEELNDGG